MITNYHILQVKYVGATNYSAPMVKIISERFNQSVKIPFTNEPGASSPSLDTAIEWLLAKGFSIVGKGEGKGHYYVITDAKHGDCFKPLKG